MRMSAPRDGVLSEKSRGDFFLFSKKNVLSPNLSAAFRCMSFACAYWPVSEEVLRKEYTAILVAMSVLCAPKTTKFFNAFAAFFGRILRGFFERISLCIFFAYSP